MSTPENSSKSQSADSENQTPVAPSFDEKLGLFWEKNSKAVIAVCVVILLAILAKGGWEYMSAQKEAGLAQEYAAATTSEKLKAYAAAHTGHPLAGVAYLRLADEAYAAGKGTDAVTNYDAAVKNLADSPLLSRAQLGLAMAKLQAGQTAEGETALKQIADRASESKGVRLEAAYQLASLSLSAGRADDVKKYSDQIIQIDAASPWAQRVMTLQPPVAIAPGAATVLPAAATPAVAEPAIKLSVPASGK